MTMRSSSFAAGVVAIVWSLGGCTLLPDRRSEQMQVDDVLAQYQRVSTSPLELQRKEFLEAAAANERASDDRTRLQLVMMLLIPDVPWRDDARAAQLLASMDSAKSTDTSPKRNFVAFLEGMLQLRRDERKRCEQRLDVLRDERRKAEQNVVNAREECKRADVLQQKLDELRDIDRDLRSKRPSRRTKP
jgi:hypothetical protein